MKIYARVAIGKYETVNLYVGTKKEYAFNTNLTNVHMGGDIQLMVQEWKDGQLLDEFWYINDSWTSGKLIV
jgi:hypothetical protein